MRGYVPAYEMVRPGGLEQALQALSQEPGLRPFAGGTDLMVLLGAGKLPPGRFLDLSGLTELRRIQVDEGFVRIGALCSYSDILNHSLLGTEFPSLHRAAADTGAAAIQNRGTIGGNIANASPAADTPPALLVYGARLELMSVRGTRELDYSSFHTGYKQTQMAPDEIISRVSLPRRGLNWHYYRKVGTRRAQAISKVCLAGAARHQQGKVEELAISVGAVAPTVVLCPQVAGYIKTVEAWTKQVADETARLLAQEIAPIDDVRSTRAYRFQVAANLLEELWQSLQAP